MKKAMLSIVMMLFCAWGYTQELPTIIPPSPEASSLAKFIETPVSHFTGTANVQVPIYTIKENDIVIPVSLNYHTRSIKVEEIAPRVGLGWALSYGGSISRQIRGSADESSMGYFNNFSSFNDFFTDFNTRINVKQTYEVYNDYDHYPDKFLINANGTSGSFIYDYADSKPVLKHFKDVQVETLWNHPNSYNNFKISGFIITDKSGVKYYYGVSADGTRSAISYDQVVTTGTYKSPSGEFNTESSNASSYPSSWQLMDVISPKGSHIKFIYSILESSTYYKRTYDKSDTIEEIISYFNKVISRQHHLKEIQFSEGKLVFNSSQDKREDITSSYSLDNVVLFDNNGKKIEEKKLTYEYTEASTSSNQIQRLIELDPKANKRLFLKSVTEKNAEGISNPPYEFTYNSQVLPSRFSTSQDIWGNYNGANNGPNMSIFNDSSNDRSVDTVKAQAGMLEEIKYPTGGKTKLIYEHNKGRISEDIEDIMTNTINPKNKKVITLTRKDFVYDNGEYKSETLTIPVRESTTYYLNCFHFSDPDAPDTYPDCIFNFSMTVDYKPNYRIQMENGGYQNFPFPYPSSDDNNTNVTFFADPKTLEGVQNPHEDESFDFQLKIEYDEHEELTENIVYAEGKRVKKIETYNSDNELVSEKEYSYQIFDAESGFINGFPHFISRDENGHVIRWGNTPGSPLQTFQGNSISYVGVSEYIGNKEQNSGKIEHQFTYTRNGSSSYEFPYHIPNDLEWLRGKPLSVKYYVKEGADYKILKKRENTYLYGDSPGEELGSQPLLISPNFIFKPSSFNIPLDSSLTDNNLLHTKDKRIFRMPLFRFLRSSESTTEDADSYKVYYLTSGTVDLLRTAETNYFDSGNSVTTTDYFYNYDKHYQLSKTKQTKSNGDVVINQTVYPQDIDIISQTTAEQSLMNAHRFVPIENYSFKDLDNDNIQDTTEDVLSHQKTIYDNQHNSSGLYLPSIIQTLKGGSNGENTLEDRIIYHSYDSKDNPTEVSKADGTKIYYVWGYQQTQPIAKIEGYTDTELTNITTLINAAVSASNNDTDVATENTLRSALNAIRNNANMVNSQITTFTYDPLIGVTSITDPRGQTVYYEYDNFNRLEFVKDADGNLLKEHKYHYKN